MRISILINNFNYGRFLRDAIDSALAQVDQDVEVIVCDDASTDDSWEVILAYRSRIRCWRSPRNEGQASAMNAGMALCTGDWVLFLDADDRLACDALRTCRALMVDGVAKIQFPLRCITEAGQPMGRQIPYLMHEGDVRPLVQQFGTYAGPPCSGNLYRRSAIARYFPLDMPTWRRAADTPAFVLSAFHGRVVNVTRALGDYRIHSSSNQARGCFGNITARHGDVLRIETHRRTATLALLARHDGITLDTPPLHTPWNLRNRALSWRTEPAHHPYPGDTLPSLMRMQADSLTACPGYTWPERRVAQAWMLATLLAPTSWGTRMALSSASGRARRWFRRLRPHSA